MGKKASTESLFFRVIDSEEKKIKRQRQRDRKWHTRRWYKENWGVGESVLAKLEYIEVGNPHYSQGASMILWPEDVVKPYKNDAGVLQFRQNVERGKKAFATRKRNLIDIFESLKSDNPRVNEVLGRLEKIYTAISELHHKKEQCRNKDPAYDKTNFFEFGMMHCGNCENWTAKQNNMRDERSSLFNELEEISGLPFEKIQFARRYMVDNE